MVYTADVLRLPYNIPIIHKLLRRLPASRLDLSLSHIGKAYRCNFLALIVFNFWQRNGGVGHIGFACTRPTDSRPRFSITVLTITVGARRFQIGRGSDPIFFAIGIWAFHTANISQVYYIRQGLRNRFPTRFFAFAANHLSRRTSARADPLRGFMPQGAVCLCKTPLLLTLGSLFDMRHAALSNSNPACYHDLHTGCALAFTRWGV